VCHPPRLPQAKPFPAAKQAGSGRHRTPGAPGRALQAPVARGCHGRGCGLTSAGAVRRTAEPRCGWENLPGRMHAAGPKPALRRPHVMLSAVSVSEGGSAKGVGERSRSLGRILARATRLLPPPSRRTTEVDCGLAASRPGPGRAVEAALLKHHAHRLIAVNPLDRLAEEAGDREHGDVGEHLARRERDRVGDDDLVEWRLPQPLDGRSNE
jgi:hypothetical protein